MRDEAGKLTKAFRHVCWDGCMFPNATMMKQQTWNDILAAMIAVRDAHGWVGNDEAKKAPAKAEKITVRRASKPAGKKKTAKKPAKHAAKAMKPKAKARKVAPKAKKSLPRKGKKK